MLKEPDINAIDRAAASANLRSGSIVLLKTLTQIKRKLQEAGDNRLPIVVYAAQNELAESGD